MSAEYLTERIDEALRFRGYVTVVRHDGSRHVGFVYNRGPAYVEMFDESASTRMRVAIDDIADVTLSGEDSAARAQRSWERRRGSLESRATSAWGGWDARPTLILVALPIELRCVARALGCSVRGATARGQIGDEHAIARAIGVGGGAAQVIAAERPRLVIACGFAGALHPSLGPGDLVLASSVYDESGDSVAARPALLRAARRAFGGARVTEGELLCATRVARTRAEKHALARPGRIAVDLESWSAARAAERAGIPWLALRVIVDPLDADLPAFTVGMRGGEIAVALRHALGGPRSMLELARLALRADKAMRALQAALGGLAPVLADPRSLEGLA